MYSRIALLSTVLAAALISSGVRAAVPQHLYYTGYLTDGGAPASMSADLLFELFDQNSGGTALWSERHDSVSVQDGHFEVPLNSAGDLDTFLDGSDHWLQVTVGSQVLLPRLPLGSVPYALHAGDADTLEGLSAAELASGGALPVATEVGYDNSGSGLAADNLQGAVDALLARIAALEGQVAGHSATLVDHSATLGTHAVEIGTVTDAIAALPADPVGAAELAGYATSDSVHHLDQRVVAVETKTDSLRVLGNTLRFEGVNVQIVNNLGSTIGGANGTGNLILGYDEARVSADGQGASDKSGSHNLVVGPKHNYTSNGGIVGGQLNSIRDASCSVLGGYANSATEQVAVVLGGMWNVGSGAGSVVAGGRNNRASGATSAVLGGGSDQAYMGNQAWADYSVVVGGRDNLAGSGIGFDRTVGEGSVVLAGYQNVGSGRFALLGGGEANEASGTSSAVLGGSHNKAEAQHSVVVSGRWNRALGSSSAILAGGGASSGYGNITYGIDSAIVGGYRNKSGPNDSGYGLAAVVVGGNNNDARGERAVVVGGYDNLASAESSAVLGGDQNEARSTYSAVAGGSGNIANGPSSVVSGGSGRSTSDTYDWAAGDLYEGM
ncbi:MAG: hypothetical protein ABIJ09_02385 [Pseudomonadota bacterium]